MRARRSIAAGLLTAATCSTTVGGFAITGSLDKAFAASPVSPPVSRPQGGNGQNQCGNQGGNGQGQSNAACANLNSEVSGPFSGTSSLQVVQPFGENPQSMNATYTTSKGSGTLSLNGFTGFTAPATYQFSGSFVLTAPDGATLQGIAAGPQIANNAGVASLSITLTPLSGTNEFAKVTGGVITLTGTAQDFFMSTISGSLSGALT